MRIDGKPKGFKPIHLVIESEEELSLLSSIRAIAPNDFKERAPPRWKERVLEFSRMLGTALHESGL